MDNVGLKRIHIGDAIDKIFKKRGGSKSEFARQIGVQQQHVNRIFERESIDTKKLEQVCIALGHNFFLDFCDGVTSIYAVRSAVANGGGDAFYACDSELIADLKVLKCQYEGSLKSEARLEEQIASKSETIEALKKTNATLEKTNASLEKTNDTLQKKNEDLLKKNEELQKVIEELQSRNEECSN